MSNQLRLLFFIVVISGALCTVQDYVIMSQCAHNKAIHLAPEGKVSVTDIPMTQNITIAGTTDFLATQVFKITLYAKETQMYLCFNNHWKLVGMRKLQETCYFNESIVHGYFEYRSAVDPKRRVGFTQRGKAIGPKKNVTDACYFFTKIEAEQFFHQHTALYASTSSASSSKSKSKTKSKSKIKLPSSVTSQSLAFNKAKASLSSSLPSSFSTKLQPFATVSTNFVTSPFATSTRKGSESRSAMWGSNKQNSNNNNNNNSGNDRKQHYGHNSNLSNNSDSSNSRKGNSNLSSTNNNHRNHQSSNSNSSSSVHIQLEQLQQQQQQPQQQHHQVRHHHNNPNFIARRQKHEREQKVRRWQNRTHMIDETSSSSSSSAADGISPITTSLSLLSSTAATWMTDASGEATHTSPIITQQVSFSPFVGNASRNSSTRRKGRRRKNGSGSNSKNQRDRKKILMNPKDPQYGQSLRKKNEESSVVTDLSPSSEATENTDNDSLSSLTSLDSTLSSDPSASSSTFSWSTTSLDLSDMSPIPSVDYSPSTFSTSEFSLLSSSTSPHHTDISLQDISGSSSVELSIDPSPTMSLYATAQTSLRTQAETLSDQSQSPSMEDQVDTIIMPQPTPVLMLASTSLIDEIETNNENHLPSHHYYQQHSRKSHSRHRKKSQHKNSLTSTSTESAKRLNGKLIESIENDNIVMPTQNVQNDETIVSSLEAGHTINTTTTLDDTINSNNSNSSSSTTFINDSSIENDYTSSSSISVSISSLLATTTTATTTNSTQTTLNATNFHDEYSNDEASVIPVVLPNNLDNSLTEHQQHSTGSNNYVRRRNLKLNLSDNNNNKQQQQQQQSNNNSYNIIKKGSNTQNYNSNNNNNNSNNNYRKYSYNNSNNNNNYNKNVSSQKSNRNKSQSMSLEDDTATMATLFGNNPLGKLLRSTVSLPSLNRHIATNDKNSGSSEDQKLFDNNNDNINRTAAIFHLDLENIIDSNITNITTGNFTVNSDINLSYNNNNNNNNNSLLDNNNIQSEIKKYYKKSTQTLMATPFHQLTALIRTNGSGGGTSTSSSSSSDLDIDIENLDNISLYSDIEIENNNNTQTENGKSNFPNSRMTIVSGYLPTSSSPKALPESIRIAKIKINKERNRLRYKKLRRRGIGSLS